MPRETELKFVDVDHAAVRGSLQASSAERQDRVFERNAVYDTPDRALRARDVLLRLREAGGRCVLTVKRPPEGAMEPGVKTWDEREVRVAGFAAMESALAALGYLPAFAYEKVRETWVLDGAVVCLDHLPFGDFVEVEAADRAAIAACAARLGLSMDAASTATYHDLNRVRRARAGLPRDENFVFSEAERAALLADLAAAV
ncbi:MAG: class IV adenylate cyclase [Desulfovibrionaceae bacterium]|jgi:adenylate cyclase class 2|nr:class IV adenylate cyclase [Desulfovibrionaceae bacterium]